MRGILWSIMAAASCVAATPAPAAEPRSDAKDVDDAAVLVASEIATWDAWRHQCSVAMPSDARAIASYYVKWLVETRTEILAMRAYAQFDRKNPEEFEAMEKKQDPHAVASASRTSGHTREQVCLATFQKMKEGGMSFARKYPVAEKLLKNYSAAHALSRHALRTYDNPMGCLKTALNQGVDYDAAKRVCDCNWKVMSASLTLPEWDEYEAAVGTRSRDQVQALPQIKRNLPKLAACAAELASH